MCRRSVEVCAHMCVWGGGAQEGAGMNKRGGGALHTKWPLRVHLGYVWCGVGGRWRAAKLRGWGGGEDRHSKAHAVGGQGVQRARCDAVRGGQKGGGGSSGGGEAVCGRRQKKTGGGGVCVMM